MTLKTITMRIVLAVLAASVALLPFGVGAAQAWGGYGYSSSYSSASASAYARGGSASAYSAASAYASTPSYYGNGYYSGYYGYTSPSYAPQNLCAYNASQFECDYNYNITNNYNYAMPSQNSYSGWYGW
ncbi:MAG: hypothetical protein ACREGH_00580 [Minisyncoccia bacterium]